MQQTVQRPPQPEISMLRTFYLVAKTSSMAGAAEELRVSQPAVSATIHKLEGIVGAQLFDRSTRPMQMTAAGRFLKARIGPLLEDLDNLIPDVQGLAQSASQDLRIGFSDSYGMCIAPRLLPRIMSRFRNLSAYTVCTPKVVNRIVNNKIDIGIATKFPNENPNISGEMMFYEYFLVATPKKYAGKIGTINDLNALSKELPVIKFNDESLDAVQVERVLRQINAVCSRNIELDTNQSVLNLVAHGIGWTVIPPLGAWAGKEHLEGVALHRVAGMQATRTFYVLNRWPGFQSITDEIKVETQKILSEDVLPAMRKTSALLADSLHLSV